MRLFAATVVLALMLADLAAAAWHPPVPGVVTRPFDLGSDPFEAGRHRGVDLGAAPGTTVRAPCAGPVAFAGTAGSSGRVVTAAVRSLARDPHAARARSRSAREPRSARERRSAPLAALARARRPAPRRPSRRHAVRIRRPAPLPGPRPPNRPATRPRAPADPATAPHTAPTTGAPPTRAPPGTGTAPSRRTARTSSPAPVVAPPHAHSSAPRRRAAAATGSNPGTGAVRARGRRGSAWPWCSPEPASACARVRGGLRAGGGGRSVAREGRKLAADG